MSLYQEPAPDSATGVTTSSSRVVQDEPRESLIRRRVPFLFSVRFGITAWYAGVLILTIAVLGIGFRILLVRALEQDAEERLVIAAEDVRRQTDELPYHDPDKDQYPAYELEAPEDIDVQRSLMSGVSITIVDTATRRVLFSEGTYEDLWPRERDIAELLDTRNETFITSHVEGYNIRSLVYPIRSQEMRDAKTGEPMIIGMVFVTESLTTTTRMLSQLNQLLLISGIVGAGIASIGGWVLAGRALLPVNRIMSSAEDIANDRSAASLSRRLEVPRTGDEIAQLAETFNDMLDRIEQAFAAQRRFVADASHELRTPLTSIKGNIDVLRRQLAAGRTLDPDDIVEALGDIGRESARMSRLVEDLLSLARNESATYTTTQDRPVMSLDVLAGEAVRTAEVLVHGQALRLEAPEPVLVHGNGDQLVQVMLILLDNALRHTPEGGSVTLRVSRDIDPIDDIACARIDVEDTGQGIESEHLPHLFERFYRAENARDRTSGGTGLGLAIALSIVRAHAGWIDVESAPDAGAHFTVWIPLLEEPLPQSTSTPSRLLPRMTRRKATA
jgi:two-component system, OmpR family, sensor kinase